MTNSLHIPDENNSKGVENDFPLDDPAIIAKYAAVGEKRHVMSLVEARALSVELARRLSERTPPVDLVIGIANSGVLVANIIAETMGVPAHIIKIQRSGSRIKHTISHIPGAIWLISHLYRLPVFHDLMGWMMVRAERINNIPAGLDSFSVARKVVALVDDCIESGQTMAMARDLILRAGAESVVIACISWERLRPKMVTRKLIDDVVPDIFISRLGHTYPWSLNSPYLKDLSLNYKNAAKDWCSATKLSAIVLDIDGVIAMEVSMGTPPSDEILLLHKELKTSLEKFDAEIIFLTHRSRQEAAAILKAAGLETRWTRNCLTANDILWSALASGQLLTLFRYGLRKNLVLPLLKKRFGFRPEQILFLDDRQDNVVNMLQGGVGCGLVAPSVINGPDMISTFDFEEVIDIFRNWQSRGQMNGSFNASVRRLNPRNQAIEPWCRTGLNTHHTAKNLINRCRRAANFTRRMLQRK